jgi:DNA repair protein RadC
MSVIVNSPTHTPIHKWAIDDRPREKMMQKGTAALSDVELLAILINNGHKNKSAVALAQEIFRLAADNWDDLARLTVNKLTKIEGVGPVKAVRILTALEIGRRKNAGYMRSKQIIKDGASAALFFKPLLADQTYESFHVIYLDRNSRVIHQRCIFIGGIAATVVDARIIFKEATELEAFKLILCHNHPSGSLSPSVSDKSLTQMIIEGARTLRIEVLDHIIVSRGGYYSMAEEGLL